MPRRVRTLSRASIHGSATFAQMSRSLVEDAFAHHIWATQRLIDACLELSSKQLETAVPGTYGSVLDTMRHLVGTDSGYLFRLSPGGTQRIDDEHMDLSDLR